ncbi:MAG: TolC family protein [Planctomycetota bacterium]
MSRSAARAALLCSALLLGACAGGASPAHEHEPAQGAGGPTRSDGEGAGEARAGATATDWSRPLTLARCLRLAEENAPTAQVFAARIAAARAELTAAETLPNPTLALLWQDIGLKNDVQQALLGLRPFSLWRRGAAERAASASLSASEAGVADERRRLHLAVGRAYYSLVAAEQLATLEGQAAAIASDLATQVARRASLGDASELELERAEAERLDAAGAADDAARRRDAERLAFSLALGAPRPVPALVVAGWPQTSSAELAAWLGRAAAADPADPSALPDQPALRRAEAELARAEAALALAERDASGLDQLVLELGARRSANAEAVGGVVALRAPLPLTDRNQAGVARARADLEAARAGLLLERRRIALELGAAAQGLERARRALLEHRRPLVARREAIAAATERMYESGDAAFQDLLLARRDVVVSRRLLIGAELEAALERFRLVLVCGGEP